MSDDAKRDGDSLSSALTTGRALILLQLLSRLLTFALNQGLVRLAPPSVFGTAAIQFDLVASTVLFISREGIRNALLRRKGQSFSTQDAALASLPLRFGLVVATAAVGIYLSTSSGATTSQPYFHAALGLYVLASLMELAIEPLYIRALSATPPRIRVRVQAEGGMAIVRAAVSFLCLVLDKSGRTALLGFAAGHAAGAAWLAGRYVYEFGGVSVISALLFPPSDKERYDKRTKDLAMANARQSVVKHVLTEADRIAVGRISPLGDQGGYAVAMNYGSLVARIVFQPLEETLLLHWSRSLDSPGTLPLLQLALRLSLHLALLLPVFLPPLLPIILPVLLPRRYTAETTAAATLQTYLVCYLPVLSLNGILEAFHAASAVPEQVARQARFMIASSGTFALSLFLLTRAQVAGITTEQALIYSSCIAMLVRIAYAFIHARNVFATRDLKLSATSIVPKPIVRHVVIATGAMLWYLSQKMGSSFRDQAALLAAGAVAGLSVLLTIYIAEKDEFRQVGAALRSQ